MKNISKKTIVIIIILLLISVSESSAISIDNKPTIVKSEEDCNCKEIDSRHLAVLEKQLNRLEVYTKLLLVLSKYNPEIKDEIEELSYEITTIREDLTDYPSFRPICEILEVLIIRLANITIYFLNVISENPNGRIIEFYIALIGATITGALGTAIFALGALLYCDWVDFPEPPSH